MLTTSTREKQLRNAAHHRGGNSLSARYDRVCPFHRRGQRCKQHDTFLNWCSEKERGTTQTQLLNNSSAMVMLTFREDTIQKVDCPYVHIDVAQQKNEAAQQAKKAPKQLLQEQRRDYMAGSKQAVKNALETAASRNALMIEALVDYFVVAAADKENALRNRQDAAVVARGRAAAAAAAAAAAKKNDGDDDGDSSELLLTRKASSSNLLFAPENLRVELQRDESNAIFADGIISGTKEVDSDEEDDAAAASNNNSVKSPFDKKKQIFVASPFFLSLSEQVRQQWRTFEITFNNVDFCACFASAVAVLARNPELFGRKGVNSIYLADNKITTDGLGLLLKAIKTTIVKAPSSSISNDAADNNNNNSSSSSARVASSNGALAYGTVGNTAATNNNARAAITGTALGVGANLASQIVLLDLSFNSIDTMNFLFELKLQCPKLLSLFIGNNPITRRPDYREHVRRTVPQIAMLDGESIRKPPLTMAHPSFSLSAPPPQDKKQAMQRAARLFIAAYLRSWENDFSHEVYRDDDATALRDGILHPSIILSLTVAPGALGEFALPGDVMTDEQIAAATEGPGMRGGRVGTRTREAALALAEQQLLARRRQREGEDGGEVPKNLTAAAALAAAGDKQQKSDKKSNKKKKNQQSSDDDDEEQEEDEEAEMNRILHELLHEDLSEDEQRLRARREQQRSITKLDAKMLRALPIALNRNSRSIAEGLTAACIERIVKGRLEVVELLAGTIYPEGLLVSHHTTSAAVCEVSPICLPSLWQEQKEAAETAERQSKNAAVIAAAKAAAAKAASKNKKQQQKTVDAAAAANDDDDDDEQAKPALFGQNKKSHPDLFIITVHGLMSWRAPSLTGQRTVTVAADQTFSVVATEGEGFFAQREAELQAKEEEYLAKLLARRHRRENRATNVGDGDEDDLSSSDDDDDEEEFKTLQERQQEELVHCMQGFRICNHAVTLRKCNKEDEAQHQNDESNSSSNNNLFLGRYLFDPLRQSRVQRLSHMYGTTPESVLRVMERTNSDAACETVLARSLE